MGDLSGANVSREPHEDCLDEWRVARDEGRGARDDDSLPDFLFPPLKLEGGPLRPSRLGSLNRL